MVKRTWRPPVSHSVCYYLGMTDISVTQAIARGCLLASLPLIADAVTAEQTGRVEEATAALTLTAES